MSFTNLATNPQFETVAANSTLPVGVHLKSEADSRLVATRGSDPAVGSTIRLTVAAKIDNPHWIWLTDAQLANKTTYTLQLRMRSTRPISVFPVITDVPSPAATEVSTEWKTYRFTSLSHEDASARTLGLIIMPKDNETAKDAVLDIASICVVAGGYTGDHFDGSQLNGRWTGVPHKSTSTYIAPTESRAAHIRNVKSFGAIGDGTTDDSAAIRNALANTDTFSSVYFPPGTYLVTEQLSWDPYRVALRGVAAEIAFNLGATVARTVTNINDDTTYAVKVLSSAPFPYGAPFGNRGMQHSGIRFSTKDKACNGLWIVGEEGSNPAVEASFDAGRRKNAHITLSNMVFDSFNVAHRIGSYTYMMGFRDCVFSNNTWASYLPDNENDRGERIYFEGCDFINNTDSEPAINMTGDQEYKFINCSFRDTQRLFYAGKASKLDFVGCHVETATKAQSASTGFGALEEQATVSFTNSAIHITGMADTSDISADQRNIGALFRGDATSSINLQATTLALIGVEALASGARINSTQTTVTESTTPLPHRSLSYSDMRAVIVDPLHNILLDGVTSYAGSLTHVSLPGATVALTAKDLSSMKRDELRYTFAQAGTFTISLPVAVPAGTRFISSRCDLHRVSTTGSAKVTGASIELLTRNDVLIHTISHPSISEDLLHDTFANITVAGRLDTAALTNTDLVENAHLTVTLDVTADVTISLSHLGMTAYA